MSQFTNENPAIEILDDGRHFRLIRDYCYYVTDPDGEKIIVPAGYVTDFASVPRLFWTFGIDPFGKPARAAIVHDYLFSTGGRIKNPPYTRDQANRIFYDAMGVLGVNKIKRWLMWKAVCIGGKGSF